MNGDFLPDPEERTPLPLGTRSPLESAAAPHFFRGKQLEAFSVRRQIAAQGLGNRLLSGRARIDVVPCGCDSASDCPLCHGSGQRGSMYDGAFADVAILLYLCSRPVSESLRALRQPEIVQDKALEWAETQGIELGSEAFHEAFQVYGTLLGELHSSQFKVASTASGGAPKNELGAHPTGA